MNNRCKHSALLFYFGSNQRQVTFFIAFVKNILGEINHQSHKWLRQSEIMRWIKSYSNKTPSIFSLNFLCIFNNWFWIQLSLNLSWEIIVSLLVFFFNWFCHNEFRQEFFFASTFFLISSFQASFKRRLSKYNFNDHFWWLQWTIH